MNNLRKLAMDMMFELRLAGLDKAQITIESLTKDETNALGIEEYLLREFDTCTMEIKAYAGNRLASLSINQFAPAELKKAAAMAKLIADAGEPLPEDKVVLRYTGWIRSDRKALVPRNAEKTYMAFERMLKDFHHDYPQMCIDGEAGWEKTKIFYLDTEGTELSFENENAYVSWQAGCRNETSATDLVFSSFELDDYDARVLDCGDMREQLEICEKMLDPVKLDGGTFTGTLILRPSAVNNYMDQIRTRIDDREENDGKPDPTCSSCVNFYEAISEKRFEMGDIFPQNCESSEVRWIVRDGVPQCNPEKTLKGRELDEYLTAQQKKRKAMPHEVIGMLPGTATLEEMIAGVDRGLLLGYVSGSMPHENGDFSGAAKNSFYIENGKIMYPVIECMVSGNVFDMMKHVTAVGNETTLRHSSTNFPYIAVDGVSIR